MKLFTVALISAVTLGHTFGFYVPNERQPLATYGSPCASCGGPMKYLDIEALPQVSLPTKPESAEYGYRIAVPKTDEAQEDKKYKFNFDVEQPRTTHDETETKSYGYEVRTPAAEEKKTDTKYSFDYTIQAPADAKPAPETPLYTFQHKPGCNGNPCTCGSGCTCTSGCSCGQSALSPYDAQTYMLPVRYDTSPYSAYEQTRAPRSVSLTRSRRQPPIPIPDVIKTHLPGIQQRFDANLQEKKAKAALAIETAKAQLAKIIAIDNSNPLISTAAKLFANPLDFIKDFKLKKAVAVQTRRRRDANYNEMNADDDRRIPMLRVKEKDTPCEAMESLKKLSESRVELQTPEAAQYMPELQQNAQWEGHHHCHKCGSHLTDSVCKSCGTVHNCESATPQTQNQQEESCKCNNCHACGSQLTDSVCKSCGTEHTSPQYVEYVNGKPVSFYPGAVQAETAAPRYIFDRYGHRYLENNGNLRLLMPQQEAIIGSQPDFAGLADILTENREVMSEINPFSGTDRMVPEPLDLAQQAIHYIHDLARRQAPAYYPSGETKEATTNNGFTSVMPAQKPRNTEQRRYMPKSLYQVIPLKYDGKDGNLVVKVYSPKKDDSKSDDMQNKSDDKKAETKETETMNPTPMMETNEWKMPETAKPSQPTVHTFTKNNKNFEVLSFDKYANQQDSNEEIEEVLKHIYGKNMLKNNNEPHNILLSQ